MINSFRNFRFIQQKPSTQLLEINALLFHGDFDHLIPIVHQLFFVCQKRMVDGQPGNLFDLGKGQLAAVFAVFCDPRPQGIVFNVY